MKQEKPEDKEQSLINESDGLEADALTDLQVADEHAEETRGGQTDTAGYNTWRTNFGRTS